MTSVLKLLFNFLDFCPLCISFWTLEALRTRWKLMGLAKNCSWGTQHPYIHEWILWLHLSVPHSHLEIRNNRRLQAWRKRVFSPKNERPPPRGGKSCTPLLMPFSSLVSPISGFRDDDFHCKEKSPVCQKCHFEV